MTSAEVYKLQSSLLHGFPQSRDTLSLFDGRSIFFAMFINTLCFRSSPNARGQVSQSCKTTIKTNAVLYIIIVMFLQQQMGRQKIQN
jgi:hypothetical protein